MKVTNYIPAWLVYIVGSTPAIYYFYLAFTNQLGADPLARLEHSLGEWALRFLILGLAITPLMRWANIRLIKYRRSVGLVAFAYIVLHFNVYLILDRQFRWWDIWGDIIMRWYITLGTLGFLLLLPLAITSNNASVRKLGGAKWQKLHKLVYPAALLGAIHYVLLKKTWEVEPIIYFLIIAILVALRFIPKKAKI